MLEITGNEISELNDTDLRSLVGLLCEAELRSQNLPTAGVTWGGHQTAKDGGLDVRVQLSDSPPQDGFIPRSVTGFQVKKSDMPASKINDEMCPKGTLREVIKELIDHCGAYIIVSGTGSTANSALINRRKAMRDALSNIDNPSNLKTDFYDRDRMSGWVRYHPSLILWVREKLGNPIQGWQPFGNWAKVPGGLEEEYLLDKEFRIHTRADRNSNGMTALDGINCLRKILQQPGSSVRLTGLSGVGKTRLVQALFDERIGEFPLNQSQAFYSDISDSPNPDPRNFAERLMVLKINAILIVDNCPPELHRHLTTSCTVPGSLVTLITVEYDVREDQPDETEVFRLEPSSISLIEKILEHRFPHISQLDSHRISAFSGGNARIAIALAKTLQRGETLTELQDEYLFQRLFHQRNDSNSTLLRSAEACSLVFSFDCRTEELELSLLGSLAGRTVEEIFSDVAELKRRDLVQKRDFWRAVLPHALANKLAQRALENIPLGNILKVFVEGGSERLLRSFSKRLSYLHQCEVAVEIAHRWLADNGLLNDISNLNELGITLVRNIAPLAPRAVLNKIEMTAYIEGEQGFTSRSNKYFVEFANLLRSLAYDPDLFTKSVNLLCRFALSENEQESHNSLRKCLESLFYIYLSETHATPNQRLNVIERLVHSFSEEKQNLGLSLLNCTLEAWHFSGYPSLDFGAHPRDYGYEPATKNDELNWFNMFINFTVNLAISETPIATKAKRLLADQFKGLLVHGGAFDALEIGAKKLIKTGSWNEGWIAARSTLNFHGSNMTPELLKRLQKLEQTLAPTSLLEKARTYALDTHTHSRDLDDTDPDKSEPGINSQERVELITRQLGREVARDEPTFKKLLPEILTSNGFRPYSFSFGKGLGENCLDYPKMWQGFRQQLEVINDKKRDYQVLRGFLNSTSETHPQVAEDFLNDAIFDNVLGGVFPLLQISVKITARGAERLKQSLEHGIAPISFFANLGLERVSLSINDTKFSELLTILASKPDGLIIAIDILAMRLHGSKNTCTKTIRALGQELLKQVPFNVNRTYHDNLSFNLSRIVKSCLNDEAGQVVARNLVSRLAQACEKHEIYSKDYISLWNELATNQPLAFLDGCLGNELINKEYLTREFADEFGCTANPLSNIADNIIINWCESNPMVRYSVAASCISAYQNGENKGILEWTQLAMTILDNAPDPVTVLNNFKNTFKPMCWSGSRSEIMSKGLGLISVLKDHKNPVITEWACKAEKIFKGEIDSERQWELEKSRSHIERFE